MALAVDMEELQQPSDEDLKATLKRQGKLDRKPLLFYMSLFTL
jgi:hypothetical protein